MYLFDFDGTLVDSNGVWVEIDNGFLARRGSPPPANTATPWATPSSPSPPSSPRTTTAWT
ncbi:hypothetical protein M5E87_14450 [Flavonifractor plautii]|nr:hypothetical protein M5E87_14450 [Flavonifractor plautii]